MKFLIAILSMQFIASAQQVPQGLPKQEIILAQPQPARDVIIHLNADLSTALESWRLSSPGITDPVTGMRGPLYPNIQALLNAVLNAPNGMLDRVLAQFPPQSIKAKQDAAEQTQKEAGAAREKARAVTVK